MLQFSSPGSTHDQQLFSSPARTLARRALFFTCRLATVRCHLESSFHFAEENTSQTTLSEGLFAHSLVKLDSFSLHHCNLTAGQLKQTDSRETLQAIQKINDNHPNSTLKSSIYVQPAIVPLQKCETNFTPCVCLPPQTVSPAPMNNRYYTFKANWLFVSYLFYIPGFC